MDRPGQAKGDCGGVVLCDVLLTGSLFNVSERSVIRSLLTVFLVIVHTVKPMCVFRGYCVWMESWALFLYFQCCDLYMACQSSGCALSLLPVVRCFNGVVHISPVTEAAERHN